MSNWRKSEINLWIAKSFQSPKWLGVSRRVGQARPGGAAGLSVIRNGADRMQLLGEVSRVLLLLTESVVSLRPQNLAKWDCIFPDLSVSCNWCHCAVGPIHPNMCINLDMKCTVVHFNCTTVCTIWRHIWQSLSHLWNIDFFSVWSGPTITPLAKQTAQASSDLLPLHPRCCVTPANENFLCPSNIVLKLVCLHFKLVVMRADRQNKPSFSLCKHLIIFSSEFLLVLNNCTWSSVVAISSHFSSKLFW